MTLKYLGEGTITGIRWGTGGAGGVGGAGGSGTSVGGAGGTGTAGEIRVWEF